MLIPGPCDYRHYRYAEAVIEKIVLSDRDLGSGASAIGITAPDPWSIPLELFKRTILASAPQDVVWNRPGISQRAAAARSRKLPALVGQFIFSTWARAQARKQVGGWARRAQGDTVNLQR